MVCRLLNFTGQRVLILAPHADDETIGCGGVIQKYLKENSSVRVLIASFVTGESDKYLFEQGKYEPYSGFKRLTEVKEAFQTLGVSDYDFFYLDKTQPNLYHSRLDTLPRHELVKKIEDHLKDFHPTVLYIPSITKHQDHEALHKAAVTATRPYFWNKSIFIYETDGELGFVPNLFVELKAEEMQRKVDALACFTTQVGPVGHPTNPEFVLVKAQFRAQNIYARYAEAFQILRLHG